MKTGLKINANVARLVTSSHCAVKMVSRNTNFTYN